MKGPFDLSLEVFLTAIAYSSSSLPDVEVSLSLDSFLAFKALDLTLSFLPLYISESVGIKNFLMQFGVTAALIDVNAAQSKLVLLENFNENYSKCLRLLEVIENGATLPKTTIVEGKDQVVPITSAEEKAQRRLEVKARNLVEGSSKRVGEELEQKSTKKQKVEEDKNTAELQSLMELIPDEEDVAIDVTSENFRI
ncbi:hypothetical protein Tco_0145472 [Tanacetum coccineum]